jgi:phage regulator Rha-like protein
MSDKLAFIQKSEVFTTSKIIATGANIKHHAVKQIIRKYEDKIKQLGNIRISNAEIKVSSKNPKGAGKKEEVYELAEAQATFLINLLKNTKPVVEFKFALTKEFYKMRKIIQKQKSIEYKQLKIEHSDGYKEMCKALDMEYKEKQQRRTA